MQQRIIIEGVDCQKFDVQTDDKGGQFPSPVEQVLRQPDDQNLSGQGVDDFAGGDGVEYKVGEEVFHLYDSGIGVYTHYIMEYFVALANHTHEGDW